MSGSSTSPVRPSTRTLATPEQFRGGTDRRIGTGRQRDHLVPAGPAVRFQTGERRQGGERRRVDEELLTESEAWSLALAQPLRRSEAYIRWCQQIGRGRRKRRRDEGADLQSVGMSPAIDDVDPDSVAHSPARVRDDALKAREQPDKPLEQAAFKFVRGRQARGVADVAGEDPGCQPGGGGRRAPPVLVRWQMLQARHQAEIATGTGVERLQQQRILYFQRCPLPRTSYTRDHTCRRLVHLHHLGRRRCRVLHQRFDVIVEFGPQGRDACFLGDVGEVSERAVGAIWARPSLRRA